VAQLARWCGGDPALCDEEQVRQYFLFLKNDRGYASQTMRQARAALTAFYNEMLGYEWRLFLHIKTKDRRQIPQVVNQVEVRELLGRVIEPRFRVCLRLIYECGLRLNEGLNIQVGDILAKGQKYPQLRVQRGKGNKDRMVPLSHAMVEELRWWWSQHQNPVWLFPSIGTAWKATTRTDPRAQQRSQAEVMKTATTPMSESALQQAFHRAVLEMRFASGRKITIHTLRHSYATHLLEANVNIRLISRYLGHATLEQTMVYLHLTEASEEATQQALSVLSQSLRQGSTQPCGERSGSRSHD
jgi:integrase/recombinase XerD